jgi:hypothetical protein
MNAEINYNDAYGDSLEKCYSGAVYDTLRTENKVRTAILKGVDPVDAYLQYRKF